MAEIVNLAERKRSLAARKGFKSWEARFSRTFDGSTRMEDLDHQALGKLIGGGEESNDLLYDLIMGIKGLGAGLRFHFLEGAEKVRILDIAVFLLDQLRFEAMRRLGWIDNYPGYHIPLVDLVQGFGVRFADGSIETPSLSPGHLRYGEYRRTFPADRGVFVRRLIPEAIEAFRDEGGEPGTT